MASRKPKKYHQKPNPQQKSEKQNTGEKRPLVTSSVKVSNSKNIIYILLCLAIILSSTYWCYKDATRNDFTNWDDPAYVTDQDSKVRELSSKSIKYMFENQTASNYHPLTMLSLAIDYQTATKDKKPGDPLDAEPFHRTSLVLHLLSCILVFFFIYMLTKGRIVPALIVALLFGIHPMHVESVAWVAERKDVLYGFFFVAALMSYLQYLKGKKIVFFLLTTLLYCLSLLSKPAAVIFPFVLMLIDYLWSETLNIRNLKDVFRSFLNYFRHKYFLKRPMWEKVFFICLGLIELIVTFLIQEDKAVANFDTFTIWQRVMFASYGFIMYIWQLIIPMKLSTFYPYPNLDDQGYIPFIFYIAPFIVLAIFIGVYLSMRKTKIGVFGILFYLVTIVLVIQFISVGRAIMSDRYTYIPYIGLFLIIGMFCDYLLTHQKQMMRYLSYLMIVVLIGWSTFLAYTCEKQVGVWKNSETLWTNVIENYPSVDVAYKNRGNYYGKEQNQPDLALKDYKILVAMNTQESEVYSNLGNIYGLKKMFKESLESYSKSIELNPKNLNSYINRGITYSMMGQYEDSFKDYDIALQLSPGNTQVFLNRAFALLQNGELDKALMDYNNVLETYPNDLNSYFYRGLTFFKLEQYEKAIADFEHKAKYETKNAEVQYNISVCYFRMKEYNKAKVFLDKAVSLGFSAGESYIKQLEQGLSMVK